MKCITYKALDKENEKILAIYIAYKGYFPNGVMLKSARHIFESGRTKEQSYQVVLRHLKLLIEHGLVTKQNDRYILLSRAKYAEKFNASPRSLFIKINNNISVKEAKLMITKQKLHNKLNQLRFRELTKTERQGKSFKKALNKLVKEKSSAFCQVSFTYLAIAFGVSRDTLRRRIKKLQKGGHVNVRKAKVKCIRRLYINEKPCCLPEYHFVHAGHLFEVVRPKFKVNFESNDEKKKNFLVEADGLR